MIVILDNIRSALNVGSVLRTCDALGIDTVIACGLTPDLTNEKVKKTALGAEKSVGLKYEQNTFTTVQRYKGEGYQIIALETGSKAINVSNVIPNEKCCLVVGNEVSGISDDILKIADTIAEIPMKGQKESLNVSVAFGIAAFTLLDK